MSLILEALKKSEAKRQLGETPGIGTPFTVAPRRRNILPLLIVLILVAGGLGWYFLLTKPSAPLAAKSGAAPGQTLPRTAAPPMTVMPQPPAPVAARPAHLAAVMPAMEAARGAFGRQANDRPLRPAGDRPAQAGEAREPGLLQQRLAGAREEAKARRSVASIPAAPPDDGANAAAAPPRLQAFPQIAQMAARQAEQAAAQRASAGIVPTPDTAPATTSAATAPVGGMAQKAPPRAAPSTPAAAAAASPQLPLYYELPFNVRKDLPTLSITMHVYAAAPDQRFVMIDGERKVEGETFKDLTLQEIRPDGMVLEFRGQRFFYPRSGY